MLGRVFPKDKWRDGKGNAMVEEFTLKAFKFAALINVITTHLVTKHGDIFRLSSGFKDFLCYCPRWCFVFAG